LVHAAGFLSIEAARQHRCTMLDIFIEIDRLLRPEVCEYSMLYFLFMDLVFCVYDFLFTQDKKGLRMKL
jgi:hypothetical protein